MADTHPNNNNIRPTPSRSASYIGTTGFNESASTTPSTMPLRDAQPTTRQDISSDSSDETEEGFVVLGDEFSAPWDGDQTKYHPPTVLDKAVQSAKQTWGTLSLASIQNSLGSAASSLAERALAKVPSSRQPSIQDISGWEPPKNAFASPFGLQELHRHGVRRVHPPQTSGSPSPISREAKLQAYRAQLEEKKKQRPGPAFVQHEQEYDPLGDSVAWQRRAVRGGDEERKRMLLEEWRVKEERGERERPGRIRRHPRRDQEVGEGFRTGEEERGELARGGAKTLREAAFKDPDGRLETAAGMERNVAVMVTMPSVTKDQGHRVSRAARGGRNCLTRGKAALR